MARSAASTSASTVASPLASATPQAMVGSRRGLRGLVQLRDPHGRGNLMRHGGEKVLVLPAEGPGARAFDAEDADALISELQRDTEDRTDLGWSVESRVEPTIGHVLQLAMFDDPPADALSTRETLADVGAGRADRGTDHEMIRGRGEREQEAVLVAPRVAHDAKEPLRQLVDVQHRADLRREPLQDRELTTVGLGACGEPVETEAGAGHVLDVLVKDAGDAAQLRGALRAVALDEP